MDPLSITASIIAVIQVAGQVAQVCKSYIDNVQDYPKELRIFFIEARSLEAVFEGLQSLKEDDLQDASIIARLQGSDGPVASCRAVVEALSALIPPPTNGEESRRRRLRGTLEALAWPLKADKARKLLDELMRHKSTISLAIESSLLQDIREMKKALSETQIREVCKWYEHTNPSPNHNAAEDLYEQGTGSWLLRSQLWMDWINCYTRCLWIHGIPGSGKTILAAYLFEQARLANESVASSECIYYYCYHGHNQDESAPFLSWLIGQLCRRTQRVPEYAYAIFQQGLKPRVRALLDILQHVLSNLRRVFIVIDAVDESQERGNLLSVVRDLVVDPRFSKVQLLVTSREYADIERTMTIISDSISMSNSLVEADIKLFVEKRIRDEPRFRTWPEKFRSEVEIALAKGAKGMFRWAVCQLDILRRLRHMDKIREAVRSLPETMDETYGRILSLVPSEDCDLVRHVLHWICFHQMLWTHPSLESPTTSLLLDAYLHQSRQNESSPKVEQHFIDAESLRESCGCLVSFARSDNNALDSRVTLAHYTVREFLESNRPTQPHALFFKLDAERSYADVCATIFRIALDSRLKDVSDDDDTTSEFSAKTGKDPKEQDDSDVRLHEYCQMSATKTLYRRQDLVQLHAAKAFLDPSKPHYKALLNVTSFYKSTNQHKTRRRKIHGGALSDRAVLFSDIDWVDYGEDIKVVILVNMLHNGALSLAHEFCQGTDIGEAIAKTVVQTSIPCSTAVDFDLVQWDFQGTVPELFAGHPDGEIAHHPCGFDNVVRFFLDHFGDIVDRTRLLHLHITNHSHYYELERGVGCLIKRLIQEGASTDPKSCDLTPLQIAVGLRDVEGVRLLLEAGADPNGCGGANSDAWDHDEFWTWFQHLRGTSPLFAVRHLPQADTPRVANTGRNPVIENLLVSHGGKEFATDEVLARMGEKKRPKRLGIAVAKDGM